MLCRLDSIPRRLIPTLSSSPELFLRRLLSDSPRRHAPKGSDEEFDLKFRIRKQDPDGPYLHLHKSKGQHILTNPRILETIVRRAGVGPDDTVLEIGPGTGNLTLKLLEASRKVVAIEVDGRMVDALAERAAGRRLDDKLTVIQKDALKGDFPPFDILVANIPYGISSPLVAKLVSGPNRFRSATLLLQKEFARRLLANPGDSGYNRLAVNVKLVADVELVMDVSKRDFVPNPKVDSSVVTIRPKANVPVVDLNEWRAFTRTCFSKKNKTLGATFKQKRKLAEIFSTSQTTDLTSTQAPICGAVVGGDGFDCDEESEEEDCPASSVSEDDIGSFREKIISVLRFEGFSDKRPSKMSNEQLLHLLGKLNDAGVYFHGRTLPQKTENATLPAT